MGSPKIPRSGSKKIEIWKKYIRKQKWTMKQWFFINLKKPFENVSLHKYNNC